MQQICFRQIQVKTLRLLGVRDALIIIRHGPQGTKAYQTIPAPNPCCNQAIAQNRTLGNPVATMYCCIESLRPSAYQDMLAWAPKHTCSKRRFTRVDFKYYPDPVLTNSHNDGLASSKAERARYISEQSATFDISPLYRQLAYLLILTSAKRCPSLLHLSPNEQEATQPANYRNKIKALHYDSACVTRSLLSPYTLSSFWADYSGALHAWSARWR